MSNENIVLVNAANVAYSDTGVDLTLSESSHVASGVITPPKGTTKLLFMLRLQATAIMRLRSGDANGDCNDGNAFTADRWYSFDCTWAPDLQFSVRFSVAQANLRNLVIVAVQGAA